MEQKRQAADIALSTSDEQTQVRVAWLYFIEGWTQSEIADALSTNRLRINRIVNDARNSGLVTITINSRLSSCIALERQLVDTFALKRAIIVPTPRDPDLVPVLLGRATADYVAQLLSTTSMKGIGISGGATLREVVRHMPLMQCPDLCVNSAVGGLTHGLETNTFDIARTLARQLNAECAHLTAPIYAGSPESRDAIMDQDVFRDALERVAASDLILLGAGDMTKSSMLMRYGLPADISIDALKAAGACGDVMAHLIDRDGRPIDHPLNRRAITLPLETLRNIPYVVIASGGAHKVKVIAAILLAKLCSVLVCDEDTATAALHLALQRRGDHP